MIIQWCPSEGIEASDELMDIVTCDVSTAVLAGAGAGKTELLAQKASYLFFADKCIWPRRILSLTFKTEAQENIRVRVDERCGSKSSRFDSFTFHAFSKSIVDRFKNVLPEEVRPKNNYDIVLKENEANGLDKILMGDLLTLAIKIIRERADVRDVFRQSYTHVFVDEFQDTTNEQYELLKLLFQHAGTKILSVGDINQSIMIWADARKTVFNDFINDFSAVNKFLIKNYRASKEIQCVLNIVLQFIKDPSQAIVELDDESRSCSIHIFKDEVQEASYIVNDIREVIDSGVSEGDICILTKQQSSEYTDLLRAELTKSGIRNLDMTDLQDTLKEPLGKIFSLFLKVLVCPDPKVMTSIFEINLSLNKVLIGDDKEEELTASLLDFISLKQKLLSANTSVDELLCYINDFIDFLGGDKIKGRWKQYKSLKYYNLIFDNLEAHLRSTCIEAESLEVATQLFDAENSIKIMNVHKCKGLEFHTVYFLGLEDQAFWNYKREVFENNCAIYVALSRAKSQLRVTYSKYRGHRKVSGYFDNRPSTHESVKPVFDLLVDKCKFEAINHTK